MTRTAPDSTGIKCPYCDTTTSVQPITGTSKVAAWACQGCGTNWATTAINPRPYLDHLTAAVALREIIALAQQAPQLTDNELRARLLVVAGRLR